MNKFFIILHNTANKEVWIDGHEVAMMTECMTTSQNATTVTLRCGKEVDVTESKKRVLAMLKAVSKKANECGHSPHRSFMSDFF